MKTVQYQTKTGKTQFRPVLNAAFERAIYVGGFGLCLACGEEVDGVEPDARRYTCESCEQPKVYGLEELMLMGLAR